MADATLGTAVLRTKLDRSGLKSGLDGARSDTQKFAADSGAAIRGIGAAFGAIAASAGVRSYVSFLRSSANLSQQADAANRLFEKSLQRTNQSLAEGAGLVDRLSTRFGVANSVIESSATLLLRQGASLDDIERALTAAGASAAAAGFDISTAFDNVATAVATGRSELLETSGIVTNLGPVTQQYAKSIGKTVDELTQQEIIQARVNAIYKETASEIEDVDEILQGLPLAQAEVTKQWRTFREDVGGIAAEVITPLTEGLGKVLGYVNDLPEPVKRAGLAMSGAAIGATALATGIVAIRTALTGFNALGLLSFGPAGWVVLGVTAIAGLVAVLAGRGGGTLESAAKAAADAFAKGDANSLTGALDDVVGKFDGEFKDALVRAQDELKETGRVGVESANNIARAYHSALAQASLTQGAGLFGLFQPVSATLRQAGASMFGDRRIQDADKLVDAALRAGDLRQALVTVNDVLLLLKDMPSTARDSLQDFRDQLVQAMNEVAVAEFRPFVPTTNPPPGTGTGAPAGSIAALRALLTESEKRLQNATTNTARAAAQATIDALEEEIRKLTPVSLRPLATAVLLSPEDRRYPGGIAGISDNLGLSAYEKARQQQLLNLIGDLDERAAASAEVAANNARRFPGGIAGVSDDIGLTAFQKARQQVLDYLIRDLDEQAAIEAERAARQATFDAALSRYGSGSTALAGTSAALRTGLTPASRQDQAAAARDTVVALSAAFADGKVEIEEVEAAVQAWVSIMPQSTAAINEVTNGVLALARAAEFAARRTNAIQSFDEFPYMPGWNTNLPQARSDVEFNRGYNPFRERSRDLGMGDGGLAEADRINRERQAAANRFSETVVSAGFSFGDSAIRAFKDGDIVGVIRAGLSGAGSIFSGLDAKDSNILGTISLFGGSIGIGGLIAGGLGLLGTLIGALTGGRNDADQVRAAGAATRGAPAVELNLVVNQSLSIASLTDPASKSAINGLLDQTVKKLEDAIVRNIIPRINALEGAAA